MGILCISAVPYSDSEHLPQYSTLTWNYVNDRITVCTLWVFIR